MKNEIIDKLAKLLDGQAESDEINAFYLLGQIRKILDHEKTVSAIRFYCNWALHIELDRRDAQVFLEKILPRLSWRRVDDRSVRSADQLLSLGVFRKELRSFLVRYSLNPHLCVDDEHWQSFLAAYAKVVENCPLKIRGQAKNSSRKTKALVPIKTDINIRYGQNRVEPMEVNIESLCIEALDHKSVLSDDAPFPMKWTITYSIKGTHSVAKGALFLGSGGVKARTFSM
jgi:hypothetical protein